VARRATPGRVYPLVPAGTRSGTSAGRPATHPTTVPSGSPRLVVEYDPDAPGQFGPAVERRLPPERAGPRLPVQLIPVPR